MRIISAFLVALFFALPAYAQNADGKPLSVIELRKRAGFMNARNNAEKPLSEIEKKFDIDDEKSEDFKKMCDSSGDVSLNGTYSKKKYNNVFIKEYSCSYATLKNTNVDGYFSKVEISVQGQKPYMLDQKASSAFLYHDSVYAMQLGCCEDEDDFMNRYDLKTGKLLSQVIIRKATE